MSRTLVPLYAADLSAFARHLGQQLQGRAAPSHLELMNMLARAAGLQNYQHLRAASAAKGRLDMPVAEVVVDHDLVERCLRSFDAAGVMVHWPARRSQQTLCLWALWSAFPPAPTVLHEREVNRLLNGLHSFGDAALLRRDMRGLDLVSRTDDGTEYRRTEVPPPPEALALIRHVAARRKVAKVAG